MRTLGEIVRAARRARGMSLEDFAAWCGVAASTVATIEYDGRVRRETIEKIAACLEVPVSELDPDGRVSAGAGSSRRRRR